MKKSLIIRGVSILFCILSLFVFIVPTVLAQGPTPTATPIPPGSPPVLNASELLWLVALTLVGILLLWGSLFLYTYRIQRAYLNLTMRLAQSGISVAPSTLSVAFDKEGRGFFAKPTDATPTIKGKPLLAVGIPEQYQATIGAEGSEKPAAGATWSIDPSNVAVLDKHTGDTVTVTAAVAGTFTLTATVDNQSAVAKVTAIAPQSNKVELPAFGAGYGAIGIAIVLIGIVMVLGLANVLPAAAISTILGGLLGYIFGSQAGGGGAANRPGGQQPPASGGGGG